MRTENVAGGRLENTAYMYELVCFPSTVNREVFVSKIFVGQSSYKNIFTQTFLMDLGCACCVGSMEELGTVCSIRAHHVHKEFGEAAVC